MDDEINEKLAKQTTFISIKRSTSPKNITSLKIKSIISRDWFTCSYRKNISR
jgi:hypothetical protein